jgi:four helix bundle protein
MVDRRRSIASVVLGIVYAHDASMRAKNLEDVVVYREAIDVADAVSALLDRPPFRQDFDLVDQLSRSSSRIGPLIAEGFGQLTDRHLASYLGRARGSALETRASAKGRQKRFHYPNRSLKHGCVLRDDRETAYTVDPTPSTHRLGRPRLADSGHEPAVMTMDHRPSTLDLGPSTIDHRPWGPRPSTMDHHPRNTPGAPSRSFHLSSRGRQGGAIRPRRPPAASS